MVRFESRLATWSVTCLLPSAGALIQLMFAVMTWTRDIQMVGYSTLSCLFVFACCLHG